MNGHKPVVILLADDDDEDRMLVCDALAESRFLPKPFTPAQVQMMLRMLASKAG